MGDLQEKAGPEGYKSKQIPNYALHSSPAFPCESLWDKLELDPWHWPHFVRTNTAQSARAVREQAGPISVESSQFCWTEKLEFCNSLYMQPPPPPLLRPSLHPPFFTYFFSHGYHSCLAEFIWDRKLFQTENSVSCVVSFNVQKQCPEVSFGLGRRLMMGWFCFECIIVHHTNRITESLGLQKTSKIIKPNTPVPTKPFHEVPHLLLHIPSPL